MVPQRIALGGGQVLWGPATQECVHVIERAQSIVQPQTKPLAEVTNASREVTSRK
jgi:hypothetical protein